MAYAQHSAGGGGAVETPVWRELRAAAEPLTVDDLRQATGADPNAIQHRLKRWERAGLVMILPPEPARYAFSPKSAALKTAPTIGSLSDDAWGALRRLGGEATFDRILALSGAEDRPLYCRLRRWQRRGHLVITEGRPRRFKLSPAAPDVAEPPRVSIDAQVAPRLRTAKDRMWAAMRVLKRFDLPLLMITAEVTNRSATDYVAALACAGYLRVNRHIRGGADPERVHATYQLLNNSGPKTPATYRDRATGERRLNDRNTGQLMILVARQPRRRRGEARHGN